MAGIDASARNKDPLEGRILNLIPPNDLARVEADPQLRDIRDASLAYETAAEELFNEIRESCVKAKVAIEEAATVEERKHQALEVAQQHEATQNENYHNWQNQYEGTHPAIRQAEFAAFQAEVEHKGARDMVDQCRRLAFAKERLGNLAIQAVLDEQHKRAWVAANQISTALASQHAGHRQE